jgi:hypothetical protein
VHKNGAIPLILQMSRPPHVVEVGMGQQDGLDTDAQLFNSFRNTLRLVAWVNDNAHLGLWAPQDGAVAGQGADGENIKVQHDALQGLVYMTQKVYFKLNY